MHFLKKDKNKDEAEDAAADDAGQKDSKKKDDKDGDNAPAKGAADTLAAPPEVCNMKAGDYMIHIFVEQAKNIKIKEGATVDPIVSLNVCGE